MKWLSIISIIFFSAVTTVKAQLLEDTDSRLKTIKVREESSRGNLFYTVPSRYSSSKDPFKGQRYPINPRYSKRSPFKGQRYPINPRYSKRSPFKGQRHPINPRYSKRSPFRPVDFRIPKYKNITTLNPFSKKDFRVSPRYSVRDSFKEVNFKVNPRHSSGSPFTRRDFHVNPPRYSVFKNRFYVDERLKRQTRFINITSNYRGDFKTRHFKIEDQHPDSYHYRYQKFNDPGIWKILKKWNVYWARLNGSTQLPKGVKESVKKPKFDRKEKSIWND